MPTENEPWYGKSHIVKKKPGRSRASFRRESLLRVLLLHRALVRLGLGLGRLFLGRLLGRLLVALGGRLGGGLGRRRVGRVLSVRAGGERGDNQSNEQLLH